MSPSQLNELWHYDMWLGHILLDIPLRQCTVLPTEQSDQCTGMNEVEFQTLKEQIRKMWIFASYYFTCKNTTNGWGLFFGEEFQNNGR